MHVYSLFSANRNTFSLSPPQRAEACISFHRKKSELPAAAPIFQPIKLFLGKVLAHIQRASREDDGALDDILHGRVDAQHRQRYEDDTQDENAKHNAADFACAANAIKHSIEGDVCIAAPEEIAAVTSGNMRMKR